GQGLEKARAGIYSKTITQDVSADRLRRFFVDRDGHYQITKSIRDSCVFARHNVLSEPPFSRIDLISFRNLLIYLEPSLQGRVLAILHYSLAPNGFLWLGSSESIGTYRDLFDVDDVKQKIYMKKPGGGRVAVELFPTLRGQRQQVGGPPPREAIVPGSN